MKRRIDGAEVELLRGDITTARVDVIVNAANQHLAGGGGVDGAIHRAGGSAIMAECREIGSCPTGEAVATTAGTLAARWVIHAVAPRWRGGHHGEAELLASAYRRSLQVADELGARSIAFPSLGTGAYGYPVEAGARLALGEVVGYLGGSTGLEQVDFYLFDTGTLHAYERVLASLRPE